MATSIVSLDLKPYRRAVALVLALTAIAKFISLARHDRLLGQNDALFGIPLFGLVLLVALVEVLLVLVLLTGADAQSMLWLIHGFASVLIGYRLSGWALGQSMCPCLGGGTAWWPWLDAHQSQVTLTIALWLWMSSIVLLGTRERNR